MSSIQSIVTNADRSHKEKILEFLNESNEIIVAVGFLKSSGIRNIKNQLTTICDDPSRKATFYIGTGLGETDPEALLALFSMLSRNPVNKLILCTPNAGIFHPKIYVFIQNTQVKIMTGSANLTEAGWMINDEVSVLLETTTKSKEFLELKSYLQNLYDSYYSDNILDIINDYKNQLENYNKDTRPSFHFKRNKLINEGIDMPRLLAYYNAYIRSEEFVNVTIREEKYLQARTNLLTILNSVHLSKQGFHDLFGPLVGHQGYEKLWHSGSIHRTTHKTLDHIPGFRNILRLAQQIIDLPVSDVYDKMIHLKNNLKKTMKFMALEKTL